MAITMSTTLYDFGIEPQELAQILWAASKRPSIMTNNGILNDEETIELRVFHDMMRQAAPEINRLWEQQYQNGYADALEDKQ